VVKFNPGFKGESVEEAKKWMADFEKELKTGLKYHKYSGAIKIDEEEK